MTIRTFARFHTQRYTVLVAMSLTVISSPAFASTCPFDNGGSDAMNDGIVLARYALGITGAPLVASTRYASLDPLQVKGNIECVGCALDVNGDGQIDTVDTTIIARHLVGLKEDALTNGLALGAGTRNTAAAVTSFLANGCAIGGALNAFTLGGNAFGDTGVAAVLGTTDHKPLLLTIGGGNGLRISPTPTSVLFTGAALGVTNGAASNAATASGATVAGGGWIGDTCLNVASGQFNRSCGNRATAEVSTISGGASNVAAEVYATIGGGAGNSAYGARSTVAGGLHNIAGGFDSAIGGGYLNRAMGDYSVISGGQNNIATGTSSVVAGGASNQASGVNSFAAGTRARAINDNSFVWGGSENFDTTSSATGQFRVFAPESIRMYASTTPGAGCFLSTPANGWQCSSDRNMKTNIRLLDTLDVLKRVIAMPLSRWSFRGAEPYTHMGPMAQDFSKAFALGADDKTISAMDSSGVALAAIQGLHKMLKDKDAKINALEKANALMQRDVAMMKKRLGM